MAPPAGAETTMNAGAQLQTLLIVHKLYIPFKSVTKKNKKTGKQKKTRKQQKINIDLFRILTDDVRSPSRP